MCEERLSSPNTVGASQSSPKFLIPNIIRDIPADITAKLETASLKVVTNAPFSLTHMPLSALSQIAIYVMNKINELKIIKL